MVRLLVTGHDVKENWGQECAFCHRMIRCDRNDGLIKVRIPVRYESERGEMFTCLSLMPACDDCMEELRDAIAEHWELSMDDFTPFSCHRKSPNNQGKRAAWIPFHSEAAGDIQYCSACEMGFAEKMDYCPHCGAKMDLTEATNDDT